jgi:hypothetical protein
MTMFSLKEPKESIGSLDFSESVFERSVMFNVFYHGIGDVWNRRTRDRKASGE